MKTFRSPQKHHKQSYMLGEGIYPLWELPRLRESQAYLSKQLLITVKHWASSRENSTAFFLMTLCLWFSYILINLVRINYLVQAVFLSLVLMTDKNLVIGLLRILPRKLCNVMIWVRRGTNIFNVKKRGMVTVLLSCFFLWCRRPVTLIKTSNYY